MRRNLLISALSCLLLCACSEKFTPQDAYGYLSTALQYSEIVEDATKSMVSDYAPVPVPDDFTLIIKTDKGQEYWSGKIGDWSESIKMPVGRYVVAARWGVEGEEGFGKSWFGASEEVDILMADTLKLSLNAQLGNCMVAVASTEAFDAYFADYNLTMTTGGGTIVAFPKSETRPVFVEAFRFSLSGTVTTKTGKSYEFSKNFDGNLKPATYYTIRLDADTIGGVKFVIQFDDQVENIVIEEDLNE